MLIQPFIHLTVVIFDGELPIWIMRPKNLIVTLKSNFRSSKQTQKIQDTLFFPIMRASQKSYVPMV